MGGTRKKLGELAAGWLAEAPGLLPMCEMIEDQIGPWELEVGVGTGLLRSESGIMRSFWGIWGDFLLDGELELGPENYADL